ncbi:DUF2179 domain-containing protein [Candidatus Woesearchaeota archaeon]|nr:DUF2179 domain-containing protein [Candidatus Woesearchaeota archaeon]
MDFAALINSDVYTWGILPLLIILARICDVSIGTLRVIFISRGYRFAAPLLGFFEVSIWLLAARQVLMTLPNWFCFVAYALGYATGTYVGMLIEDRLSIGQVVIRVITRRDSSNLLKALRGEGFVITTSAAKGPDGKVKVVFAIIERHDVSRFVGIVKQFNPHAFYAVEDVRFVRDVPHRCPEKKNRRFSRFGFYRQGK